MRSIYISFMAVVVLLATACTKDGASADAAAGGTGTGGSLARFTIAANHLYLADYGTVEVYDLADPANPVKKTSVNVGFGRFFRL